jgi:hypothetical protein
LALVIPANASGSYLYEVGDESLGIVSSPSPHIPQVGEMLEVMEGIPGQIPSRLFQIILEPMVSYTM